MGVQKGKRGTTDKCKFYGKTVSATNKRLSSANVIKSVQLARRLPTAQEHVLSKVTSYNREYFSIDQAELRQYYFGHEKYKPDPIIESASTDFARLLCQQQLISYVAPETKLCWFSATRVNKPRRINTKTCIYAANDIYAKIVEATFDQEVVDTVYDKLVNEGAVDTRSNFMRGYMYHHEFFGCRFLFQLWKRQHRDWMPLYYYDNVKHVITSKTLRQRIIILDKAVVLKKRTYRIVRIPKKVVVKKKTIIEKLRSLKQKFHKFSFSELLVNIMCL